MNKENDVISSLVELESFLLNVENGGLGLKGVSGVGMATNNSDGSRFVAVFDDNQKLLLRAVLQKMYSKQGKIWYVMV